MNFRITFLIIISIFLTACPSAEQPKTNTGNTNSPNVNANKPTVNTNSPIIAPTAKPEVPTTNNAPTLAPIVQAYYDALKKKDDAAVRKIMSAGFIKTAEADMKEEGKKSLAAFLAETDTIPDKPMEVRNEKIEGDRGVAELKGGAYASWFPLVFVKENGVWKITNESPELKK